MRKGLPTFATLLVLTLCLAPAARAADPPKDTDAKDKKPDVAADINKPRADARTSGWGMILKMGTLSAQACSAGQGG